MIQTQKQFVFTNSKAVNRSDAKAWTCGFMSLHIKFSEAVVVILVMFTHICNVCIYISIFLYFKMSGILWEL